MFGVPLASSPFPVRLFAFPGFAFRLSRFCFSPFWVRGNPVAVSSPPRFPIIGAAFRRASRTGRGQGEGTSRGKDRLFTRKKKAICAKRTPDLRAEGNQPMREVEFARVEKVSARAEGVSAHAEGWKTPCAGKGKMATRERKNNYARKRIYLRGNRILFTRENKRLYAEG